MSKKKKNRNKNRQLQMGVKIPCPFCLDKKEESERGFLMIKKDSYTSYKYPIVTVKNEVKVNHAGMPTDWNEKKWFMITCTKCKLEEKVGYDEGGIQEVIKPLLEMLAAQGVDLSYVPETNNYQGKMKPDNKGKEKKELALFLVRRERAPTNQEEK